MNLEFNSQIADIQGFSMPPERTVSDSLAELLLCRGFSMGVLFIYKEAGRWK